MKQSGQLPSELVDEVVSPNGVTHALLKSLKSADWSETIHKGIDTAVKRSDELSRPAD
jgi:pyrroline-5-carboxylate reductase